MVEAQILGADRVGRALRETAEWLEHLVRETLERMNAGADLDAILHEVRPPPELAERPYLQPVYDDPEFVVRNVWRLYGGWYDGNPANLKPAPDAKLAVELARLVGGSQTLAKRAAELAGDGELRLACHLAELAVQADPDSREAHGIRRDVYDQRRKAESSLMARGIYGWAARESARAARPGSRRAGGRRRPPTDSAQRGDATGSRALARYPASGRTGGAASRRR